ncbi:MAG: TrkA family potassium uptake protein, partial [Mucinivorans sp.]
MKYIVVGLGNFGGLLATRLTDMGHEVIGVDSHPERVAEFVDRLSMTVCLDGASADALSALPLADVNVVIVAIGENFAASVQTVAQLRRLGVKRIIARGLNPLHIGVLQTLGVERVVFPEKDGAELLSQSLSFNEFMSSYRVDNDHYVMQFTAPRAIVGRTIDETRIESDFPLKVITIKQIREAHNILGLSHNERSVIGPISGQTPIEWGDILVVFGTLKAFDS